jgi:hypothetical protein
VVFEQREHVPSEELMNNPAGNEADRSIVDELLAEYLQRIDNGEEVDRDEFLRQHAEHANSLRELLDAGDVVDGTTLLKRVAEYG